MVNADKKASHVALLGFGEGQISGFLATGRALGEAGAAATSGLPGAAHLKSQVQSQVNDFLRAAFPPQHLEPFAQFISHFASSSCRKSREPDMGEGTQVKAKMISSRAEEMRYKGQRRLLAGATSSCGRPSGPKEKTYSILRALESGRACGFGCADVL